MNDCKPNMGALRAITERPDLYKQVKPLLDSRAQLAEQISEIDEQLVKILENSEATNPLAQERVLGTALPNERGPRRVREAQAKPTKAGGRAYQIMEYLKTQTEPKSIVEIAEEADIPEPTVRAYLYDYLCFANIHGKGYIYQEPE